MGLFNFWKASSFFTAEQLAQISQAVKTAEGETSGEIRVHIEKRVSGDVLDRAAWIFNKIGMQKTAERNGVLFYLALRNRKFAVIGDSGIHAKVPDGFWDSVKDAMEADFRESRFTEGLVKGILMAGDKLREHFPHKSDDVNELSDEVSFGKPGK